jgi:hypothetical protein
MTARELLQHQLDESGHQITQSFAGIDDSTADRRLCPSAMSLREMATHLCEVYRAVTVENQGEKYAWGTYRLDDASWSHLMDSMAQERAQAIATLSDDEASMKRLTDFIVLHDAYHVGQISQNRIHAEDDWNPYGIYRKF